MKHDYMSTGSSKKNNHHTNSSQKLVKTRPLILIMQSSDNSICECKTSDKKMVNCLTICVCTPCFNTLMKDAQTGYLGRALNGKISHKRKCSSCNPSEVSRSHRTNYLSKVPRSRGPYLSEVSRSCRHSLPARSGIDAWTRGQQPVEVKRCNVHTARSCPMESSSDLQRRLDEFNAEVARNMALRRKIARKTACSVNKEFDHFNQKLESWDQVVRRFLVKNVPRHLVSGTGTRNTQGRRKLIKL